MHIWLAPIVLIYGSTFVERALLHIASVNEVTSKAVKMYSDIEVQVSTQAKLNSTKGNKKPPTPILFINNDMDLVIEFSFCFIALQKRLILKYGSRRIRRRNPIWSMPKTRQLTQTIIPQSRHPRCPSICTCTWTRCLRCTTNCWTCPKWSTICMRYKLWPLSRLRL